MDEKQRALAAEIRGEMARREPPVRASDVQKAIGVSSTAWGTYFVQVTRDVPLSVVFGVARFLDMPTSELLRRAEQPRTFDAPSLSEHIIGQLSPEAQEQVRQAQALLAERSGKAAKRTTT